MLNSQPITTAKYANIKMTILLRNKPSCQPLSCEFDKNGSIDLKWTVNYLTGWSIITLDGHLSTWTIQMILGGHYGRIGGIEIIKTGQNPTIVSKLTLGLNLIRHILIIIGKQIREVWFLKLYIWITKLLDLWNQYIF